MRTSSAEQHSLPGGVVCMKVSWSFFFVDEIQKANSLIAVMLLLFCRWTTAKRAAGGDRAGDRE